MRPDPAVAPPGAPGLDAPRRRLEPWIVGRLLPLDSQLPVGTGRAAGRSAEPSVEHSDWALNTGLPRPDAEPVDAAVLVPLVERPGGLTVLLTRRADTLSRHTGQVAFPGGRADPGETAVETALREAEEEVGLERTYVRPVGLSDAYRTSTGFRVTPVVAFVAPNFTPAPALTEVAEVFEPPFAWLMDPVNHQLLEAPAPDGSSRRFYAMVWEGRLIWGATAGMLRGLHLRLSAPETSPAS